MGYLKRGMCTFININGEVDSDEKLLMEVQTNILKSEKNKEPSSEINSSLLRVIN